MSCLQHVVFRGDCREKSTFLIASPRSSGEGDDTLPSFSLSLSSSASDCTEACEDETDAEATTDPSLVDKPLIAPPGDEPGDADVKDTALTTPAASSSSNCMEYRAVDSQNMTGDTNTHTHHHQIPILNVLAQAQQRAQQTSSRRRRTHHGPRQTLLQCT